MLLELDKVLTSIINVNYRKENHGKEKTLATDVKFSMLLPVSIMHEMSVDSPPISFSEFFYDDPVAVEGSTVPDETTSRKRELGIAGISIAAEFFSHNLSIQADGEHSPALEFPDVKINGLSIVFEQERQIKLTGRFQFEMPYDDEMTGRLAGFIKTDAKITVTPPSQMDLVDEPTDSDEDVDHEEDTDEADPLYEKAKELVINRQRATASLIQKELKIGYNRAARMVEALEAGGVIGPHKDNAPRDVLIHPAIEAITEASGV